MFLIVLFSVKVLIILLLLSIVVVVKLGVGWLINIFMSFFIYIWIVIIEVIMLCNYFDKKFFLKKIGMNMEIIILNNEFFYWLY